VRRIFSVLVENQPGVLARVAGLFARRRFNIESLAVGATQDPSFSCMTIVVDGDEGVLQQVQKHLDRLINVVRVSVLEESGAICRELALVRVNAAGTQRTSIIQVVNVFKGKIVDVAPGSLVVEITGDRDKISALLDLLGEFGIQELVRTGEIAIARGRQVVNEGGICIGQGAVRT